jgi:hypothetical protein
MKGIVNVEIRDKKDRYWGNCPDCGVAPGEIHEDGCDVEICTVCGGQRLQCLWLGGQFHSGAFHDKEAAKWTGYWPVVKEDDMKLARERGIRMDQLVVVLADIHKVLNDARTHVSEMTIGKKGDVREPLDYVVEAK